MISALLSVSASALLRLKSSVSCLLQATLLLRFPTLCFCIYFYGVCSCTILRTLSSPAYRVGVMDAFLRCLLLHHSSSAEFPSIPGRRYGCNSRCRILHYSSSVEFPTRGRLYYGVMDIFLSRFLPGSLYFRIGCGTSAAAGAMGVPQAWLLGGLVYYGCTKTPSSKDLNPSFTHSTFFPRHKAILLCCFAK